MSTKSGRGLVVVAVAALVVGAAVLGAGLIARGAALQRLDEETTQASQVAGELTQARGLVEAQAGARANLAVALDLTDAAQTMTQAERGRVDLAVAELSALVSGDYTSVNDYISQQNELGREGRVRGGGG
jgi:cytochrome c-type biogenesis protein CcmE